MTNEILVENEQLRIQVWALAEAVKRLRAELTAAKEDVNDIVQDMHDMSKRHHGELLKLEERQVALAEALWVRTLERGAFLAELCVAKDIQTLPEEEELVARLTESVYKRASEESLPLPEALRMADTIAAAVVAHREGYQGLQALFG